MVQLQYLTYLFFLQLNKFKMLVCVCNFKNQF